MHELFDYIYTYSKKVCQFSAYPNFAPFNRNNKIESEYWLCLSCLGIQNFYIFLFVFKLELCFYIFNSSFPNLLSVENTDTYIINYMHLFAKIANLMTWGLEYWKCSPSHLMQSHQARYFLKEYILYFCKITETFVNKTDISENKNSICL